jgi:hypothetical protein
MSIFLSRARYITAEFRRLGLPSFEQVYAYELSAGVSGTLLVS